MHTTASLMRFSDHRFHISQPDEQRRSFFTSVALRWLLSVCAPLFAATTGSIASTGTVEDRSPVRSQLTTPIGPRGGVMMMPLTHQRGQSIAADEIEVRNHLGDTVAFQLVWIGPSVSPDPAHWTSDPRGVVAVSTPDSARVDASAQAYVLVHVPVSAQGPWWLNDQQLQPQWRDLPPQDDLARGGTLTRERSLTRPDPESPFDYWRWVLLADQMGVEPPELEDFSISEQLVASYHTNLWMIGLARIEREAPATAARLKQILTRICTDGDHAFAAWPANPGELHRLLSGLLDESRSDQAIAAEAAAWATLHERPVMWIEQVTPSAVAFAVVNPAQDVVVARFSWLHEDDEIPLAMELPAGRVTRITMDRVNEDLLATQTERVVRVQVDDWYEDYPIGAMHMSVRPPGLVFPPLQSALTLEQLQTGQSPAVRGTHATLVQVRKLGGRWEVFFECHRPMEQDAITIEVDQQQPRSLHDIRSREGVMLVLGSEGQQPDVQLFIPESGWYQLFSGENDGTLQVHRQSYEHRWYCRVVLPERWIESAMDDGVAVIGFVRARSGSATLDSGPYPVPPWRTTPGMLALRLADWGDMPTDDAK